jgi:hypothetical protein
MPQCCAARRRLVRVVVLIALIIGLLLTAPAVSQATPTVSQGTPAVSQATPAVSQGTPAASQGTPAASQAVLFRVFLRDGGVVVSYGDFATVGDRVIASIPIGGTDAEPILHLLSIPAADVDWDRTTAYARAARAQRYAETRGEADFTALSREVAGTLNQVGMMNDPASRLAIAETAQQQLAQWPQEHHGYRGDDIAEMAAWLDQVVSELRIAAGQSSFNLSLVARTSPAGPDVTLLAAPSPRERLELGLDAARRTPDAAERVSLLRAIRDALAPEAGEGEGGWAASLHARASAELASELRISRAYADLTERTLARAAPYVRRADVRGLEALVRTVLTEDERLQRLRPADVAALLATLDARIDAARQLRLARDAWALRAGLIREYWRDVRQGLDRLLGVRAWLADIRDLAGPSPGALRRLSYAVAVSQHEMKKVTPPAEVSAAHATLQASAALAAQAGSTRYDAIRSGNMDTAWQASSAASGALMLLDRAIGELRRITRAPEPSSR